MKKDVCILEVDSPCFPPSDYERKQCGCKKCLAQIKSTCEYPLMGGLCGNTAKFHGKTSGIPYCQDHGNLIKRWATEELIPI